MFIPSATILVVFKRSALQTAKDQGNTRILSLIENRDPSVAKYASASLEHQASFQKLKNFLSTTGCKVLWATKDDDLANLVKTTNPGLVISLGGDGTVLTAAKWLDTGTPLVGINSAPTHSVGALTCGTVDDFITKTWPTISTQTPTEVIRLQVRLNNVLVSDKVLNDVLYAAAHPAATARYILTLTTLSLGEQTQEQKSSGVWVSTPAGSTGAMASAGGYYLRLTDNQLQFKVRELYREPDYTPTAMERILLEGNLFSPGETLTILNKTTDAIVSLDGPENTHKLVIGDVLEFSYSPNPLLMYLKTT